MKSIHPTHASCPIPTFFAIAYLLGQPTTNNIEILNDPLPHIRDVQGRLVFNRDPFNNIKRSNILLIYDMLPQSIPFDRF